MSLKPRTRGDTAWEQKVLNNEASPAKEAPEKPKPKSRKRAAAPAARGDSDAALLEIPVVACGGDAEETQDAALDRSIVILRGLLPAGGDAGPLGLAALRRRHGGAKIAMVMQKPLSAPGWNLPKQWSTVKALGPYIDLMADDVASGLVPAEPAAPEPSPFGRRAATPRKKRGRGEKPKAEVGHIEFAANVDMVGVMDAELAHLRRTQPPWMLWQSASDCLRFARQGVSGMTAPQMYLKRRGVWTGGHEENLRFSSVNCCHGPGSSTWYAVDQEHAARVRSLALEHAGVDIYVAEGNWWPDPDWLRSHGVPVRVGLQKAGDVVVLKGGTLHWVVADSVTVHSSWNFGELCAGQLSDALDRAAVNERIGVPNLIAIRTVILDVARHLVAHAGGLERPGSPRARRSDAVLDARAKRGLPELLGVVAGSVAATLRSESEALARLRSRRLSVDPEPAGALVVRCDACAIELPCHYVRCDGCLAEAEDGSESATPFLCVGCGLRHRGPGHAVVALSKGPISEVRRMAVAVADLKGRVDAAREAPVEEPIEEPLDAPELEAPLDAPELDAAPEAAPEEAALEAPAE